MRNVASHPLRVLGRLCWLAGEAAVAALDFVVRVGFRPERPSLQPRARWLQRSCRRGLRVLGVALQVEGRIPAAGLLVCNHLTYLDILVLSALTPAIFVAKREVKRWPVFGWFARCAGTLFVDREKRIQVAALNRSLEAILDQGALVVLFPEGTSSDGRTVLPFKSSLLEPAVRRGCLLSAGLFEYHLADGDVGEEVCYWKDMTFLPHLVNLLSKRRIGVSVRFAEVQCGTADRKALARDLHSAVMRLKATPREHDPGVRRLRFHPGGELAFTG